MALPLIFSAGASLFGGLTKIAGGFQQRQASKAQALGAQIERDTAKLRRVQIMEQSRENLNTTLDNIAVLQSARGVSIDSQTSQGIERRTIRDAYRDEAVATLSELTRAGAAEQARRGYASAARWALPLSVMSAAGDFASAYSGFKAAFALPKKG